MSSSCVFRIAHVAALRAAAIVALVVVLGRVTPARADNVTELVRQLESDDSERVRLSAALNLTKLGDPRAILPLTKALGNDPDKTVRGAAAHGLGKLVTDRTDARIRKPAIAMLTQARDSDDSGVVRGEADNALKAIGVTASGSQPQPAQGTGGGIYVNIGPMASKTGDTAIDTQIRALMVKTANLTMAKVASNMAITWPGGAPTKAMLDARGTAGFYVDGTVNELKVKESGSSMTVSCKINMLLASFPDKSIFGFLTGGASLQASGSKNDIALAREECVTALVEDLITKKIVPTINSKAKSP